MKKMVAVLALLAAPALAFAQTQSAGNSAEMRKLDFLLGAWEGEGWMDFGPGQRRAVKVKESVQGKAEGSVLTLEGLGKAKPPSKDEETVVHNAFGVVWYDGEARRFRMMAWRVGGAMDADITVGEKSLVWGFRDQRAGQIRFTIKLDEAGRWLEIGEISRDGTSWNKFFEMRLKRADGN
ncbi:MAG TPA: hypothetical protein VFV58_26130 [Blastocatellia bacterium]|jgi:hypothetical protein|nr:hypothetical protein [Blastocatellia bacterium]